MEFIMPDFASGAVWLSLLTLTFLEIVLGIAPKKVNPCPQKNLCIKSWPSQVAAEWIVCGSRGEGGICRHVVLFGQCP